MSIDKELQAALKERTVESHTVALGDLAIRPEMQMRSEMNNDAVHEYAEVVDELPPIDVHEVDDVVHGVMWYVTDGFHRYFAHEEAGKEMIDIRLHRDSTYDEAFTFAMTANYKNAQRPSTDDAKRSVEMLLEHFEGNFKYDSKVVTTFLTSKGVSKRSAERNSKSFRDAIDKARDKKIIELLDEGRSNVEIGKVVGCSKDTVRGIRLTIETPCENTPLAENRSVTEDSQSLADLIEFDDETEDSTTKSSVDAWNEIHAENEQARLERQAKKEAQGISGPNTTTTGSESSNEAQGITTSNTSTTGTIEINLESAKKALAYVEAFIDSKAFEDLEFSTRLERIYRKYYTN